MASEHRSPDRSDTHDPGVGSYPSSEAANQQSNVPEHNSEFELESLLPDGSSVLPAIDDADRDDQESRLRQTVYGTPQQLELATEEADSEFEPRQVLAGRYHVIGEIARGGMGVVLKAWDDHVKRHCALKVLHRRHVDNLGLKLRFEREARLNGFLEHPGVVPMHDIYLDEPDSAFFSTRYVEGRTLSDLLMSRVTPEQNLPHFLQIYYRVCETVAYAHSRRVIHRDIKPQNVMVGQYGVVKVMDWGLAKLLDDDLIAPPGFEPWNSAAAEHSVQDQTFEVTDLADTQHGTVFGTLSYAPPEQVRGDHPNVTERSDVFALGGVLCEILTGHPTYTAQKFSSLYKAALNGLAEDAIYRLEQSTAERTLIDIAIRCLNRDPARRMRDAGEVCAAIADYLASDLRRAERDQVRFFDLSLDLFCIAGLNGYFRRVNVNFERVLGYPTSELISRPFSEFIHPDDQSATIAAVQQLNEGKPVVRFINRYRHRDGYLVKLEWVARSVPDEGVIYAVARDITQQTPESTWSLAVPQHVAQQLDNGDTSYQNPHHTGPQSVTRPPKRG